MNNEEQKKYIAIDSRFSLDKDAILPPETRLQLDECIAKLRFHKRIYEDWNFISVDPLGANTILNFYGPPGTGKTLAAEALAGTIGQRIIQIGIAEVESKFMGDTAKNIQAAFQSARDAHAVLFFDEADTLLGKRLSSVTQGVDNEVNSMRSTLLIELEKFDGIVIFATNFAKNYDEAFRSRISHHIKFALPDLISRNRLWDRMLVSQIPLEEEREHIIMCCSELSEGFSGREIRTCMRLALPKAFLEASITQANPKLKLEHLKTSITQIRIANKEVASSSNSIRTSSHSELSAATKLLGINPATNLTQQE
jgi:AAA+ superfamily predicted ATPase